MISSSLDIIDSAGTSPSLRKGLWVAMVTMHFYTAQTGLFMAFFSPSGCPREQFCTNSKLSVGCKVGQIRPGVVGLRPKSVYL